MRKIALLYAFCTLALLLGSQVEARMGGDPKKRESSKVA